MSLIKAIIIGIIQGLTEFLPVSSSGHIVIMSELLGIDTASAESDLLFTLVLHLGTLIAVIICFRQTLAELIKDFFLLLSQIFRGQFKKENAANCDVFFAFV